MGGGGGGGPPPAPSPAPPPPGGESPTPSAPTPSSGGESGSGPSAASLLGGIGSTTAAGTQNDGTSLTLSAGKDVYGPFEAGFTSMQDNILSALGCSPASLGYLDAGLDTALSEAIVSKACGISLPSGSGASYKGIVGSCGGHTNQYHFHERLSCLYDTSAPGHSAQVALMNDGKYLYGKWETAGVAPDLDACGGHYGTNPDSTTSVYHYHVQDAAPFTLGCFGPNADGSLVSVSQCRDLYAGSGLNGGGCDGTLNAYETEDGTTEYDNFCPCFDANGSNSGVAIVELPAVLAESSETGSSPTTVASNGTSNGTTNSTSNGTSPSGSPMGPSFAPGPAMDEWTQSHWTNGTARTIVHEMSFTYPGNVEDITSAAIEAIRAAIAKALNLIPAAVQIRCVCSGPCSTECSGYEMEVEPALFNREGMRSLLQTSDPTLHIRYAVTSEDLDLATLESTEYINAVWANLQENPSEFPTEALEEEPTSSLEPEEDSVTDDTDSDVGGLSDDSGAVRTSATAGLAPLASLIYLMA